MVGHLYSATSIAQYQKSVAFNSATVSSATSNSATPNRATWK